jgi:hypothetical protein
VSAPSVILKNDTPRRPRGKVAMVPMIICFGVIVILRLATLAYRRPDMTPNNAESPVSQSTAAPTSAVAATPHPITTSDPAFSKLLLADHRSIVQVRAYNNIDHPTTHAMRAYVAFFPGASNSATGARSSLPTLYCDVPGTSPKCNSGSLGLGVAAGQRIAGELYPSRNLSTLAPHHRTV